MTEQQEITLLANVKSLTDRLTMVDTILRAQRMGQNMALVFRCGHSGLYYDGSYVRQWGKDFGIGLGPSPVSEALNSDYDTPLPRLDGSIKRIEQIAFGVGNCCAQMDAQLADLDLIEEDGLWAVPAEEDPDMEARMLIIRPKQLANPRGTGLLSLQTEWNRQKGLLT